MKETGKPVGDFNVACAISGAGLMHRRAVLIPVAPGNFPPAGTRNAPGFSRGANWVAAGETELFSPLTYPIFGTVGSYGTFDEIEETPASRWIAERLGVSVEEFARAVCYGETLPKIRKIARLVRNDGPRAKKLRWDGQLYGVWIAREVWDAMSSETLDECDGRPDSSAWESGWLNPGLLKRAGFIRGKKDAKTARAVLGSEAHGGDRYSTPYRHPGLPRLVVWCDEFMSSDYAVDGVKRRDGGFSFRDLVLNLRGKKRPGHYYAKPPEIDPPFTPEELRVLDLVETWARATPYVLAHFEEILREMKQSVRDRKRERENYLDPFYGVEVIQSVGLDEWLVLSEKRTKANIARALGKKEGGETPPESEPELDDSAPNPIEPGAFQKWCTRDRYNGSQKGRPDFHVLFGVTEPGTFGKGPETRCERIEPCDCDPKVKSPGKFVPRLPFPEKDREAILAAMREKGWRPRKTTPPYYYMSNPYARNFAKEFFPLYGVKGFRRFPDEFVAMYRFLVGVRSVNRFLHPTSAGCQYGHPYAERALARIALKIANEKIRRRRENR